MDDAQLRPLLHQVANLLAVIQVQVETARALGTAEAAQQALALIQRSAGETEALLRSARHAGEHPTRDSARRRE